MSVLRFTNLLLIVLAIPILILAQEIIIDSPIVDGTNQTVTSPSPTKTNSTYITPPQIQIVDILPDENRIDADIHLIKQNTTHSVVESQESANNQTLSTKQAITYNPLDDEDPVGEDFDPSDSLVTIKEGSYNTAGAGLFSRSGQQQQHEQFNNKDDSSSTTTKPAKEDRFHLPTNKLSEYLHGHVPVEDSTEEEEEHSDSNDIFCDTTDEACLRSLKRHNKRYHSNTQQQRSEKQPLYTHDPVVMKKVIIGSLIAFVIISCLAAWATSVYLHNQELEREFAEYRELQRLSTRMNAQREPSRTSLSSPNQFVPLYLNNNNNKISPHQNDDQPRTTYGSM